MNSSESAGADRAAPPEVVALNSPTPATVPALGGPAWLEDRRRQAAEAAADRGLPSTDEEVWRYSRIADLDLDEWPLATERPPGALPAGVAEILAALPDRAATVVVRNGFVVHAETDPTWAAEGLYAGPLVDGPDPEGALGATSDVPTDLFHGLNDAYAAEPVLVAAPRGLTVDAPVIVVDWVDAAQAAVYPRLVVRLGEDADLRVLAWQGSADVAAFVAPVVELDVARAARLGYTEVQDRGGRLWQITSQVSRVEADATLTASHAGLGGEYARVRTDCRLVGRGATGNLHAVYFGEGDQTLDFRTFQDHGAPDTTSNLLFKGVVGDRSRSVYTGLIKVEKDARGTNAFQTNRNIKLSAEAWAESVPNLEIENNDVHCSHASTVGPIDEEQRFYLESRGVPTEIAERLIVAGFFDEVTDQLPVPAARPLVERLIEARLDRREQP
ncbi:MAG: Fe-S cluster assembly protein SufD [Acidimicrobiales bacterium]|nr:Fe-S cluster assembly protein SufD [Acidimicrobiales bacterium]